MSSSKTKASAVIGWSAQTRHRKVLHEFQGMNMYRFITLSWGRPWSTHIPRGGTHPRTPRAHIHHQHVQTWQSPCIQHISPLMCCWLKCSYVNVHLYYPPHCLTRYAWMFIRPSSNWNTPSLGTELILNKVQLNHSTVAIIQTFVCCYLIRVTLTTPFLLEKQEVPPFIHSASNDCD